jgi:hypothetical protein
MASVLHPNPDSQGGNLLSPDRAIAEVETFLLYPDPSWICDPPKTIAEREFQKSCCLRGHSEATTRSVITTPASEDFSGFRFLCCPPQVILLKHGEILDERHHLKEFCLLMDDLEGVF